MQTTFSETKTLQVNDDHLDSSILQTSELEQELKQLIEVTEPYYSLQDIRQEGETISAIVHKQLADSQECIGMSYSEAGRHMAILGSMAIANTNPKKEKHYYLANRADVRRVYKDAYDDIVHICHMKTISFNRKKAVAAGTLETMDGRTIYTIEVEYSILTSSLFERMFKQHKQETINNADFNPYKDLIPLENIVKRDECCTATLGIINNNVCVGHFDNYPALPVARIAQSLTAIAGTQYCKIKNKNVKQFQIKNVLLEAKSFIFAGETLNVKSTYDPHCNDNELFIDTFAYTNNDDYAARLSCWFY